VDHFEIPLTQGFVAKVSVEDVHLVDKYKWHAKRYRNGLVYAASRGGSDVIYMHRLLAGIHGAPRGFVVDHLNHDGLDNTRNNLKVCSHGENLRNQRQRKQAHAWAGVSPTPSGWVAKIGHNNMQVYLGHYPTQREAGIAYAAAEKLILASFGRLA